MKYVGSYVSKVIMGRVGASTVHAQRELVSQSRVSYHVALVKVDTPSIEQHGMLAVAAKTQQAT